MARIDSYSDSRLESWPRSGEVVLFDLEYTSWPGSLERNWSLPCEQREIVQFGAVKAQIVNSGFKTIETFDQLVRPVSNPCLSVHFCKLTGITNDQVEREGVPFAEAWDAFSRFCNGVSQLWCVGKDGEVLRENFVLRGMDGVFPTPCFDIRPALAKVLDLKEDEVISSRLTELVHLEPIKHAHQAMDDALAVLNALDHLARQGSLA